VSTAAEDYAQIAERCKRGLHVATPVVREHPGKSFGGDIVFAATCCDRLFAITTITFPGLMLREIEVESEELEAARERWEEGGSTS
jgi:hypothetical protein